MSDERLRELERQAAQGDEAAAVALLHERLRLHEPKRRDLLFDGDGGALGFVAAEAFGFEEPEEVHGLMQKRQAFALALVGDDGGIVRVVVGDALNDAEQAEWVARARWPISLPSGTFAFTNGLDPDSVLKEELEEEPHRRVEVPPGDYLASVYTHMPSMNAPDFADQWDPPLGTWYRKDRAGEPFPSWLARWVCYEAAERDPGHEADWDDAEESMSTGKLVVDTDPQGWVAYLLHLEPLEGTPELSVADPPDGDWRGMFPPNTGVRRPERCPGGLRSALEDPEPFDP